ncbi:MAG: hypothetical protein HYR98_08300, partial [Nitrospirae bacterium]|nr:hypothetical protein [Nitrospirota bacterium]
MDGVRALADPRSLAMAGRIGGTIGYALILTRHQRSPAFDARDARVLNLIRPHWEIAMENALALAEISRAKESAEKALRLAGKIALIAARDGSILYATERAGSSLGLAARVDGLPPEIFSACRLPDWLARVLSPSPRRGGGTPGPRHLLSSVTGPSPRPSPRGGEGKECRGVPWDRHCMQERGGALWLRGGVGAFLPAARMRGFQGAGIRTRTFNLDGWGSLRLIEIVEDGSEED